ncbi:hypothetical protein OPV22_003307 [Ensete ventricosum]|uniref:Uncharacterized protein n=1 Tax=Ensete ventricosum TaxID=4639 RepID=A0AAV8S0G8_ENSVE|nr:hypothetical protein OPV22_003307 [Ensete ventricosum]RWV97668.1 hypothetical protein GW17_00039532 [Ensete ventricosum]RWW53430.1 hypothetical protein BHE74_00040079 [Ensete ventricosum]RZS29281.1 hypothetical protein BHM03_00062991 [Ensete ventricosum]
MGSALPLSSMLLTFVCSLLLSSATSPHGLAFENPMSFPPSAYEFFHPTVDAPATAPLPASSLYPGKTTARAKADAVVGGNVFSAPPGRDGAVTGAIVAVVLGLVFVTLVAVVAAYIAIKRRNDVNKANSETKADA